MTVHRRREHDLDTLVAQLDADEALTRESAEARLIIMGRRAAGALAALVAAPDGPQKARAAALRCLGTIGGPHAEAAAFAHVADPADFVACEAIVLLGTLARGTDDQSTRAIDRLTSVVVSTAIPVHRRSAALRALGGLSSSLLAPIHEALARDTSWTTTLSAPGLDGGTLASIADQATLPPPSLLATLVREHGHEASLMDLHKLVGQIRHLEEAVVHEERNAWMALRGLVHETLAARGSRVAFHDVREALEQCTGPLPMGFLSAASRVGDLDCLDAVVAAWSRHGHDGWFRGQLAGVFREIAAREGLTRHHAVARKLVARWPAAITLLATVPRVARRASTPSRTRA